MKLLTRLLRLTVACPNWGLALMLRLVCAGSEALLVPGPSDLLHLLKSVALVQITSAADSEAVTGQKLVKGHAYSLTGAVEVRSGLRV